MCAALHTRPLRDGCSAAREANGNREPTRRTCRKWTEEEIALLQRLYPDTRTSEIARQLNRTPGSVYIAALRCGIKREKGAVSRLSHSTSGKITIRQTARGPRQFIKVDGRWKYLHHHIWEEHNGPIPSGHLICFRDGNTLNASIGNLYIVSLEESAAHFRESDEYVAAKLAAPKRHGGGLDRDLYEKMLKEPALLELKRRQLALSGLLKKRSREEKEARDTAMDAGVSLNETQEMPCDGSQ